MPTDPHESPATIGLLPYLSAHALDEDYQSLVHGTLVEGPVRAPHRDRQHADGRDPHDDRHRHREEPIRRVQRVGGSRRAERHEDRCKGWHAESPIVAFREAAVSLGPMGPLLQHVAVRPTRLPILAV